jgi:cytoplasmic iron level regulating protein YaaA (DUF328/UPF0246 family)|tara:strand:+ start:2638 stop:3048 length:411 start_codon:yes stop_codon:yes gene_type:complete
MLKIAFIACSKTKESFSCEVRQLYQGALFKKALEYCSRHYDEVYVLSAKHGLLELSDIIAPYEETLNTKTREERMEWTEKVKEQLRDKSINGRLTFFTGENYHEFFVGEKPLQGISMGSQLKWFNEKLKEKGFFDD